MRYGVNLFSSSLALSRLPFISIEQPSDVIPNDYRHVSAGAPYLYRAESDLIDSRDVSGSSESS
jgi:hypothetical protein